LGAHWRHYRATVDRSSETWSYLELAGPYATFASHDTGFQTFVRQAERIIREE
jgi:hypothetical protein